MSDSQPKPAKPADDEEHKKSTKVEDTGANAVDDTNPESDGDDNDIDEVRKLLNSLNETEADEEGSQKSVDDDRSIFIGNVDYSSTVEELHEFFKTCGTIDKITIKTDSYGKPKGLVDLLCPFSEYRKVIFSTPSSPQIRLHHVQGQGFG